MANVTIYPQGVAEVTVPATQSIAITNYGGGIAKIYYLIENPNRPDVYQFQQTLNNSAVTLGAFSAATTVKIEANNSKVVYDVGSSPDTGIGDADTLNGLPSDTADTASTIAARDSSGNIAANAFESTVATGTAPLTVASTTNVANLNASRLADFLPNSTEGNSTVVVRDGAGNISLAYNSKFRTKDSGGTVANILQLAGADNVYAGSASYPLVLATSIAIAFNQNNVTAKTISDTLLASQIAVGIITVNNGAAGVTTLTLPTAANMDSYYTNVGNNSAFDFSVINISTVAAEDCVIATNTGWTLVGDMNVEANDAARARSAGTFRARKTGAGAWTLYRLS